ncbi:hypothetical protein FPV67DRAFT_1406050 [Lyophyllum atratum]|nr:hypothetical protein FPV67DRAFT_1406050 [Lyophyllum atratum]
MPLLCSEDRVFGCAVGRPQDPTFEKSCQLAYEAIMEEGRNTAFSYAEINHRRGSFPAVNVGVTMGPGARYPTNLKPRHADMLSRLLGNPHIIRLTNFADAAFNLWAPKVHKHYRDHLSPLFDRLTYLRRIFPESIFPAAAFNFGPDVYTNLHRDCSNVAAGWCAIYALGVFDSKKGGHLVLPDLKIVLEFPPGSLIFIPSATLMHGNIPVQAGDSRVSFTQYCGGGLFRYVDNGYRTETQLRKEDPGEHQRMCALKAVRWKTDLDLYSKLGDIVCKI